MIKKIDLLNRFKKIHGDKYNYDFVDYEGIFKPIKISCPIRGIFEQTPAIHLNGSGCPINDFYDYSLFKEYKNVKQKIRIICPEHGEFIQQMNNHLNGQGCPVCLETKGERKIREFLQDNNIKFQQYKSFDDCRYKNPLPFDFYLTDLNICIEYDGPQHFEPISYFGGEDKLEYTKILDEIKTNYCIKNNMGLIRIRYDEDFRKKLYDIII